MLWVALAGPAANLFMALGWMVLYLLLYAADLNEEYFFKVAQAGILVNRVLFAFNLFPLPPLDGGRILVGLLPWRQAMAVSRIEPWGFYIVMALVITGVVNSVWMSPLMDLTFAFIKLALSPLSFLIR